MATIDFERLESLDAKEFQEQEPCPEEARRKIFIVGVNDWRLSRRLLSGRRNRKVETY